MRAAYHRVIPVYHLKFPLKLPIAINVWITIKKSETVSTGIPLSRDMIVTITNKFIN